MNFPKYLLIAIEITRKSIPGTKKHYCLGAIGKRTDGVVVQAINGWMKKVDPQHHAEVRISRKLDIGATVYVARTKKDGSIAIARPCGACKRILKAKKVKKVFYTIDENSWGVISLQDDEEKIKSLS